MVCVLRGREGESKEGDRDGGIDKKKDRDVTGRNEKAQGKNNK